FFQVINVAEMRLLRVLFMLVAALLAVASARSIELSKRRMYVRVPFMHNINPNQLSWIIANREKVKKFAQPEIEES
ncbi:hypothetical protein PENTCL1PPCAC_7969, partial [Pristionchus entomophagus]